MGLTTAGCPIESRHERLLGFVIYNQRIYAILLVSAYAQTNREATIKVIIGPDISFYDVDPTTPQGIDFVKMRQQANFVLVRAGQGLFTDSTFAKNWSGAKQTGLPRGAYWVYDSRADPTQQADLWFQSLGGDFGELPLFADIEETYNGPFKGWANWITFLDHLKSLVGTKEIGIYTASAYWSVNAPNPASQAAQLQYFHQYTLWIASYGMDAPSAPQPWANC